MTTTKSELDVLLERLAREVAECQEFIAASSATRNAIEGVRRCEVLATNRRK